MLNLNDSTRINVLRFPLIVCVILIHNAQGAVVFSKGSLTMGHAIHAGFLSSLQYLISNEIARIAVPIFFLLSGYLFFQSSAWSKTTYLNKVKNRMHTLLIPFLIWNLLTLGLIAFGQSLSATQVYFSGKNPFIADLTFFEYFKYIFGIHINPIAYQFWFIRDLMLLVLISPLLYFLVKRWAVVCIFGLFICWFLPVNFMYAPSIESSLFFTIGSWCAIHQKSLFLLDNHKKLFMSTYLVTLILSILTLGEFQHLHKISVLLGIVSALCLSDYFIRNARLKSNLLALSSASFFVFATHEPLLSAFRKLAYQIFNPQSDLAVFLLYLGIPAVLIVFLVMLYHRLNALLPSFTRIITGGR